VVTDPDLTDYFLLAVREQVREALCCFQEHGG
jgi:hypothetical protein